MTRQEAIKHIESVLTIDETNRYRFACRKAFLIVRLLGTRTTVRFAVRDKVAFRIDELDLIVEELETGIVRQQFSWKDVDNLAAGEPETDSGLLFQG